MISSFLSVTGHRALQPRNEKAFWRARPALGTTCTEVGKQPIHQGFFCEAARSGDCSL